MYLVKKVSVSILMLVLTALLVLPAFADEAPAPEETVPAGAAAIAAETGEESAAVGLKAVAVGLAIGLAAAGGAVGMGIVGGKAADGISRQPEMEGKIRTTLMLDLVFIEKAIIYALLVVILVIFVL